MSVRAVILRACGWSRRYGARPAVLGLDLTPRAGEVGGLRGPNDAGETTAFRMLTSVLALTHGQFRVAGIPATRSSSIRRRIRLLPVAAGHPVYQLGQAHPAYHAHLSAIPARAPVAAAGHLHLIAAVSRRTRR